MRKMTLVLITGSLVLGGCAHVAPPQPAIVGLQDRLPYIAPQLDASALPDNEPDRQARVNHLLQETLSPAGSIELLLLNSPMIRADLAALGIAEARRLQAGLVNNPGFKIGALRPGGGGRWQWDAGISQSLLDFLTRPLRVSLAETELAEAQLQVYQRLAERVHQLHQHYFIALAAREKTTLATANLRVAEAGEALAQSLYAAGNIPERIYLEYQLATQTHRRRLHDAETKAHQAQLALATLLGLDANQSVKLPDQLPAMPPEDNVEFATIYEAALQSRIDLQLLEAQLRVRENQLTLQQKKGVLTRVDLGADVERESDGSYKAGPHIALDLPIFDRGQARRQLASASVDQARALLTQKQLETHRDIAHVLAALAGTRKNHEHIITQSLPLQSRIQHLRLREYNFMLTGAFELMQVKEAEIVLQHERIDTLSSYWLARVDLALASGQSLLVANEPDAPSIPIENQHRSDHSHHHHGSHHHD